MLGSTVCGNFLTLAKHASEADIRSIPYAGDAVWRDVKLMRTALIDKEMLLAKPHVRKILKHSNGYIANMTAYYNEDSVIADEGTGASPEAPEEADQTDEANDAHGFDMVDMEEVEKTGEMDAILDALEGLSIKSLRTIKSLIKNTDWD